jgi:hypothetical protein
VPATFELAFNSSDVDPVVVAFEVYTARRSIGLNVQRLAVRIYTQFHLAEHVT